MRRKKNKFFTFIFSLFPGAGEMYMGFMKMGISLMGLFLLFAAAAIWLQITVVLFAAVVVWFYSFFNVHNISGLPDDKFEIVEDKYLVSLDEDSELRTLLKGDHRKWISYALIFVGVYLLWDSLRAFLLNLLPDQFYHIFSQMFYNLPRLVTGIVIILLGVAMIRGKKKQLKEEDKDGISSHEATEQ